MDKTDRQDTLDRLRVDASLAKDRQYMLHRWVCFRGAEAFGASGIEDAMKAAAAGFAVYDAREGKWIEANGDYREQPLPDVASVLG